MDRCLTDTKRPQKPDQNIIPIKTITTNEETKIFHEKSKFEQYFFSNLALQRILGGKLQYKESKYTNEKTKKIIIISQ